MLTEKECEIFSGMMAGTMVEALSIRFLPTDDEYAVAEMPISPANISEYSTAVHH